MSQEMMATLGQVEEGKWVDAQLRARRAQLAQSFTRYIGWGTGLATVALVLTGLLFHLPQLLGVAVLTMIMTVAMVLYPALHRRGHIATGMSLAVGSILLACTGTYVMMPELGPAMAVGYVVVILLGNTLLGAKGGGWLAVVSTLLLAAVNVATAFSPRLFAPLDETVGAVVGVFILMLVFSVTALLVRQNMIDQEVYFRQSELANLEIEKRAAAEREQRERLETTVQKYAEYMTQVGQGNLASRLSLDGEGREADDPLVMLGYRLNETTASLQRMIAQVHEAATQLSSASAEILAATTQQASGASEQSAAISQTTTTVDEVKAISQQAMTRAQEVTNASQRTVEVSRSGQKAVQDTIESMTQIKGRVEGIAENILALSEQTQQIGEIIATVNEIASQSNILALNASIEAARAGEHGKGFAVVAVEVRNLAEQSKQATAQVKAILSEIQKATNATVMATEEGTKGVDKGVQLVAQTRQAIEQLAGVIGESAQVSIQMVAGGQQQVSGIEQIALAMQNINQATVQSLASIRQAERSAQNLNELARSLNQTVAQYQL